MNKFIRDRDPSRHTYMGLWNTPGENISAILSRTVTKKNPSISILYRSGCTIHTRYLHIEISIFPAMSISVFMTVCKMGWSHDSVSNKAKANARTTKKRQHLNLHLKNKDFCALFYKIKFPPAKNFKFFKFMI